MPKHHNFCDVSEDAYKNLVREENWLDACRTHHGNSLQSNFWLDLARTADPDEIIDVIEYFVSLVNKGITPPASILTAVARGFEYYLTANNNAIARKQDPKMSLDRAFNLQRKPSVGHPLKHRMEKRRKGRVVYEMWMARKISQSETGKRISKNKAFEQVIAKYKDKPYEEDVMLKEYTKLKADELFDSAYEALEEAKRAIGNLSDKGFKAFEKLINKL
jgi:hypothetical protein